MYTYCNTFNLWKVYTPRMLRKAIQVFLISCLAVNYKQYSSFNNPPQVNAMLQLHFVAYIPLTTNTAHLGTNYVICDWLY